MLTFYTPSNKRLRKNYPPSVTERTTTFIGFDELFFLKNCLKRFYKFQPKNNTGGLINEYRMFPYKEKVNYRYYLSELIEFIK